MKITKHILVLIGLITMALSTAVYSAPEKKKSTKNSKPPAAQTLEGAEVKATQNGDKITISWTLPKDQWRMITLSRNDQEKPKGRVKVNVVNPNKRKDYVDTVPDASKSYWYWLKATRTNGDPVEIGPISVTK
ncbi:hypothetical protein M2447_002008 [Ereboglobus sp. PH5-10]|uniref:hypothetical protein n=1 Tax=Ereboglobus sp. PH5-10 TaxID=2940629 RepID=UPI002404D78B|nr:hypothetical protein [Ereboglobus sp. PH5-10]MDF9827903.1 hypothetical protein [Ereboglobus sp. PH5-10]